MHLRSCLAILVALACLALPVESHAEIAPDTNLVDRQNQTLRQIATRYEWQDRYSSCFKFGAVTIALVAQLELGQRGEAGGKSLSEGEDAIEHLAEEAIRLAGDSSSPCVWENAGSPGTMHGLLGLGMILHRYQDQLPGAVADKIKTAARGYWRGSIARYLVNGNISIVAGRLLAGEAMGYDSQVWQDGLEDFDEIYEYTTRNGGLEMNAPIYTAYQFAALVPLMEIRHEGVRQKARILLEYLFLVHAHLSLPGGSIGAPQSRDYAGGARDSLPTSLHRIAQLYTGEDFAATRNVHLIGAAVDYALPEAIRSIYMDKGDGYEFWAYTPAPVKSRTGRGYDFGEDGYPIAPWHAVVTPDAMLGVNYAFRYQSIHVSMGVHARTGPDAFPALYQYQPYLVGDTSETGGGLPSSGGDSEANDFVRELYDFRRMVHGRSLISIWDPTLTYKDSGAVRQEQNTRVHVPDYSAYGGEMRTQNTGGWLVGRVGDSYIAYYPLGDVAVGPERRSQIAGATGNGTRDSEHFFLKLNGRSGGIVELATTDQFASIDAYVDDLKQRHIAFSTGEPLYAEFDALDPDTGDKVRIRLDYKPEKRWVDGVELSNAEALDHGWLESTFMNFDRQARVLTLARECYPQVVYNLASATVREEPGSGPGCFEETSTTVFSGVPHFGDFANYTAQNPARWTVVDEDGDNRLFLQPYEYVADGDRLGELAVVDDRSFGDFHFVLDAKTHEDMDHTENADYAVVFGYQDESNYYFLLANATAEYSELFVLEDGTRRQIGLASSTLVPDEEWHRLEVMREGADIRVLLDGQQMLAATDSTYGAGGVGIGTLNDSALFDNIDVTAPGEAGDAGLDAGGPDGGSDADTPAADAGSGDDAGSAADAGSSQASGASGAGSCGCDTATDRHATPAVAALALLLLAIVSARRRRSMA